MRWSRIAGVLGLLVLLSATPMRAAGPRDQKVPDIPVSGMTDATFAGFDEVMTAYLKSHQVPGGALAVARNDKVIYARGFGYADLEKKETVRPGTLFRIASLSKPITSSAVFQLVERGKLKLDAPVYDVLELKEPDDSKVKFDDRWKRITILQLLQHTGGWNRERTFDPMFHSPEIEKELNVMAPACPDTIVQYMLCRQLDFDPGSQHCYSNFGYCLLGRVIEKVSGQDYETYVRKEVLAPLGIKSMRLGKTLEADRAEGEVKYYTAGKSAAVLGPNLGELVPLPYGAWSHEATAAHGGWLASAEELVRFGMAFDQPGKCKILSEKSVKDMFARPDGAPGRVPGKRNTTYYACGWYVRPVGAQGLINAWHTGSLPGTMTLLVRRCDGLTWVVLFNARDDATGEKLAQEIDSLLHDAADAYLKAVK
jgi:N-acyl-D-amino-acid deacylase